MATYQVEFAYAGLEDDELTLEIGDILLGCLQKEDGWLEGELNGKRGMFPDNFVKKCQTNQNASKNKSAPPPIPSHKPKTGGSRRIFKAQFAYRSGNDDELTFEEGQKIMFVSEVEDGWARGELEDGSIGLYPTNFVLAAPEPDVEKEVQLVIKSDVPVKATKTVKKEAANDSALYYKVAFDYHADNGDELTLAVGDVIKVIKKESADEGWWEGENCATGGVGVFPKNFLDQTPIPAPGAKASPAMHQGRTKTVVMRGLSPTDRSARRNIVSEIPTSTNFKMMDNANVKNRPKGPKDRRPPKKKAQAERNPTSPLDENPPLEDQLETKLKLEPTPSPAPAAQTRSPLSGGVPMPGMPNINIGSLRKKQQKMAEKRGTSSDDKNSGANRSFNEAPSVSPLTVSDDKSDSAIPPWKKELMNAKRGKSIKPTSNVPDKPIAPANDAPPPWVKEIEKKKSSFTREDIKPESGSVKKEPATSPTPKPQPIAGTRSSFRPSASGSSFRDVPSSAVSTPQPSAPSKPQSSGGGEPTLSDLLREIQSLKTHVQSLSRRLDEESNLRTMLEKKVNSLQRD